MKTIKTHLRVVAFFFSAAILFQGCSVYHTGARTLDEAVQDQKKVKIITQENRTLYFKKIVFNDGKYYGVKKLKDNTKDVWIFEKDIKKLRVENKTMSVMLSLSPLIIIGAGIGIFAYAIDSSK